MCKYVTILITVHVVYGLYVCFHAKSKEGKEFLVLLVVNPLSIFHNMLQPCPKKYQHMLDMLLGMCPTVTDDDDELSSRQNATANQSVIPAFFLAD